MPIERKIMRIFYNIIFILVASMIIAKTLDDVSFYLNKEVITVKTPADFEKLHDNLIAEVSLDLDFKQAYSISYLSHREFVLVPFSGLGYKLMYVIEGPLSDKLVASLHPPYTGRIVGKNFLGIWEVYDQTMELNKLFDRDHIIHPSNTMLLCNAPKEFPNLWQIFISVLSIIYLIYLIYSLSRLIRRGEKASNACR